MYDLIKQCNSGWKMTPLAAELVSNKPCFYSHIFFATGTRVSQKSEKSVTASVLSILIGWSMLHFLATDDVSMNWLAFCALHPDSPLPTVQTGLKRESDNKRDKMWTGANSCKKVVSNESHATANVSLLAR